MSSLNIQSQNTKQIELFSNNLEQGVLTRRIWVAVFSALGPSAPRLHEILSVVFEFLPACVIKCSRVALIKHNCEFSIHKY